MKKYTWTNKTLYLNNVCLGRLDIKGGRPTPVFYIPILNLQDPLPIKENEVKILMQQAITAWLTILE